MRIGLDCEYSLFLATSRYLDSKKTYIRIGCKDVHNSVKTIMLFQPLECMKNVLLLCQFWAFSKSSGWKLIFNQWLNPSLFYWRVPFPVQYLKNLMWSMNTKCRHFLSNHWRSPRGSGLASEDGQSNIWYSLPHPWIWKPFYNFAK